MKNVDFFVVVIVLGVVFFLLYSVLPIFIGKYSEDNSYVIGNDFCESDVDCVILYTSCGECSCDVRAVNKEYFDYWHTDVCTIPYEEWDICDIFCELPLSVRCVENECVLRW